MDKLPGKLSNDFAELVHRGVESDVLDYKAALCWTKMTRQAKGKIVRHCLALANTKGGCIVIGVGEDASGHPSVYMGLSREEVHSFDPTTVGQFVNRYVEPPIEFTIERPVVDGRRYAIFMVRPFRTLPHVCTSSIEGELQTGVFYIRTPDASSRPAYRAIEMQMLIQRALRNQRGILYENRMSAEEASDEEFKAAVANAAVFFKRRKNPPAGVPSLLVNLTVTPPSFHSEAFSLSALRRAVDAALPSLPTPEFLDSDELRKAYVTNTSLRALSRKEPRMWQVFKSGLCEDQRPEALRTLQERLPRPCADAGLCPQDRRGVPLPRQSVHGARLCRRAADARVHARKHRGCTAPSARKAAREVYLPDSENFD
mgnify:CR=1 FL=1